MVKESNLIYIKGNVPSSKNSKQFVTLKNGNKLLMHSKTTREYIEDTEDDYIKNKELFKNLVKDKTPPYHIGFYFIRNSKRKFDYINIAQIVQDLMVKHEWVEDDNCDILIPHFMGYGINKDNAGVVIKIIDL